MFGKEDLNWLFPLLVGYIPSGIAYGVLATAIHVPWYFTMLLSAVVYSGAVQSAFVGFWSIGLEPVTLILTAALLNLRHSIYGPHLEEHFENVERGDIFTLGPLLTDEIYALGVGYRPMSITKLRYISLLAYFSWMGSSALGIAFTGGIPQYVLPALYLALPALFLALMMPKVRGRGTLTAALVSIVISVAFRLDGFPEYFILISILAGVAAGIFLTPELRRVSQR